MTQQIQGRIDRVEPAQGEPPLAIASKPPPSWRSAEIGELAAALAKAQAQMGAAKKASKADAGSYSYKYATLDDCWKVAREPLGANGLALTQLPHRRSGALCLLTVLMHESGQWQSMDYELPTAPSESRMNVHQAEGSALTYARRYSLCCILGIPTEDDDGASAQQPQQRTPPRPKKPLDEYLNEDGELIAIPFGTKEGESIRDLEQKVVEWYAHTMQTRGDSLKQMTQEACAQEVARRKSESDSVSGPAPGGDEFDDEIPF